MRHFNVDTILYSRPSNKIADQLGQTHYSYSFAARYFLDMFQARHIALKEIEHPEAFKSRAYATSIGLDGPSHPHLIFRSTEDIRPIAGAYNIGCFAWEFEFLSEAGPGDDSVLDNQVAMLSLCQEIWTPSTYARDVMIAHGLPNCHVIPAPILAPQHPRRAAREDCWEMVRDAVSMPMVSYSSNFVTSYEADLEQDYERLADVYARPLGEQPALKRALEVGAEIFITVLNPYDRRKNIANLIEGFLLGTEGRDCVLVVKMATSGVVKSPSGYLYHQLRLLFGRPHCINEDRVILVGDYFTELQMNAIYDGADFYLCTSLAEGQNLPLIEAIGHGCVAVSTFNTAMADYLDDATAIRIEERSFFGLVTTLAGDVAKRRYGTAFSDRFNIARAVASAVGLPPPMRETMAEAAARNVRGTFSPETVYAKVRTRLAAISGRARPIANAWNSDRTYGG